MMNNLLKTASKSRSVVSKKPLFSAVESQRALHTPIGNTKSRDESFQVRSFDPFTFPRAISSVPSHLT